MYIKKLKEKRALLMEEVKTITEKIEKEERSLSDEERTKVTAVQKEISDIDATIKVYEETRSFKNPEDTNKKPQVKGLREELRSLSSDTELEIGRYEIKGAEHRATGADLTNLTSYGTVTSGSYSSSPVGNIGKTTYADYILEIPTYLSQIYNAVRKERFTGAKHQMPIQKDKVGKFVPMNELDAYVKAAASFGYITLTPKKYGLMLQMSEEAIEDTGYAIEAELLRQFKEAYAVTMDELIVTGDANVFGLEKFDATTDDSNVVPINAAIDAQLFIDLYYALPISYRKNAKWVISDNMSKVITGLKDGEGRPLFIPNYTGSPFGADGTILGRPVIINENIKDTATAGNKPIFFGDLQRALIIGERKSFTIKKSNEFGFIDDSIAIKGGARVDIQSLITNAMAYAEVQ